eukprot:4803409-Pyramimonas_sp.AAC.1
MAHISFTVMPELLRRCSSSAMSLPTLFPSSHVGTSWRALNSSALTIGHISPASSCIEAVLSSGIGAVFETFESFAGGSRSLDLVGGGPGGVAA